MAIKFEGVLILDDKRDLPVVKVKRNSTVRNYWHNNYRPPPSKSRPSDYGGPLKSPAMQLNEMRQDVTYKVVSQKGPPHWPTFVVTVKVDGNVYKGRGRSKPAAKQNAAENALRSLRRHHEIRGRQPTERKQICKRSKIFEQLLRKVDGSVHKGRDSFKQAAKQDAAKNALGSLRHHHEMRGRQSTERKQSCKRHKILQELSRRRSPELHTDFIDEVSEI